MRICLIDKDVLVREGLARLLRAEGHEICGTASSASQAVEDGIIQHADILILTPSSPDEGPDAITHLGSILPGKPVLVLASEVDRSIVRQCLLAGANGFLVRWAQPQELLNALALLLSGKSYLHPEVVGFVVEGLRGTREPLQVQLSSKEMEVLGLVASGNSNAEIAAKLFVSPGTVKNRLRGLFEKYAVNDRTRLVAEAMKSGVLKG